MDLALSPEQEEYRNQVREVLSAAPPPEPGQGADREPGLLEVYRTLGARGLLAPDWPKEYGGLGLSPVEKNLLTEELARHGVPVATHTLAVDIVGLGVLLFGRDDQRQRYLPPLARGEATAAVLFSEPDAGSDLGALQTRAEPDGDGWRLHGRKIYNLKAHLASVGLCAARTTSAGIGLHGITLFLVPLPTPGVLVSPLWSISDERFNEVTLSGVRVTRNDMLGELDDGFYVLSRILGLERTGIEFEGRAHYMRDLLMQHAADVGGLGDPGLVELDARVRASRLLSWRCVENLVRDSPDDVACAVAKWYAGEAARDVALHALDVFGLGGVLAGQPSESAYRDAPGQTLASGSAEMMLGIIASTGLGLPS
jgi:alkylation response protein AidB-like acyl-CoA dehydrogenase